VITIGASRPLSSRSILWQMIAGRSPARIRVASDWLRGARTTLLTDDIRPGVFNRFRIVWPVGRYGYDDDRLDDRRRALCVDTDWCPRLSWRALNPVRFDGGARYQV
jgi:hypothetical protein